MKTYYTFPDTSYPPLTLAILERIRLFFCTLLYPDETYANSQKRFVLTDISPNMSLRESIQILKLSNATFPFTAYSIGEQFTDTERENTFARTQLYYSSTHGGKIHATPLIQEIPMISFFSTAKDFDRAQTILTKEYSLVTKLTVPITINDVLTSFTIIIDIEIGKGSYAFEFEQQLIQGNIYDLVHSIKVYYHQIVFNGSVAPVDDILFSMKNLESPPVPNPYIFSSGIASPNTPTISSTIPEDEEEDVNVNTDIIINFSSPMNEDSVEDNFSIYPYINADFSWNSASTQLVIDILTPLVSGTNYEASITDSAKDIYDIPIESDYDFEFTTE